MIIRSDKQKIFFIVFLLLILLAASFIALIVGSVEISVTDLFKILFTGESENSVQKTILFRIRLPRILLGLGAGSSLALAGVLVQGLFRNPLVEPYTLGISGGSILGVALSVLFGWISTISIPIFAFLGASLVSIIVWVSSIKASRLATTRILLTGVMISFISSSALALIYSIVSSDELQSIVFWTLGSLEQDAGVMIYVLPIISTVILLVSLILSRVLNALAFGEEEAAHLGVNVSLIRFFILVSASVLTALAVSQVGVIGFVGLIVPHIMRIFIGRDHFFIIPSAWLGGAAFLLASDVIARTIADPIIIPVGAITGLLGGVIFLILLNTTGKEYV